MRDAVVTISFEVDAVKKVESGDCMVRLTAYHRSSGNVCFLTICYFAVVASNKHFNVSLSI